MDSVECLHKIVDEIEANGGSIDAGIDASHAVCSVLLNYYEEGYRLGQDSKQSECLECKRLRHILNVMRFHINSAYDQLSDIEDRVQIRDGRLMVWVLGEWFDVDKENAEAEDE